MISGMRYRNRKLTGTGREKRRNHRMPEVWGGGFHYIKEVPLQIFDDFDSILSAFLPILVCKPFLKKKSDVRETHVLGLLHINKDLGFFFYCNSLRCAEKKYPIWSCFCMLPTV